MSAFESPHVRPSATPLSGRGPGAPRVLVSGVVLDQPMSGVRRHNQELLPRAARLLAERGGELALLLPRGGLPFELAALRAIESDVPARPVLARALLESRAIARELVRARTAGRPYDVVHTAHLPAPRLPHDVARSVCVHDLRALELAPRGIPGLVRRLAARPLLARALADADVVLAVSETVREALLERFDLARERTRVVPNAADHFAPLPRRPGPGAPILCVAHLEPRKNQELLLRALALDATLPSLALAGAEKRGERARLERLAAELGVRERVRFLGAVGENQLPALYAECACAVLPSRLEGFGIPALEAMRARAPLAVSNAGALPEVAGDAVRRFAPGDPADCARALRAALAQSERELDAAEARARRFAWDASAAALIEAFEFAAAARSRP